VNSKFKIQNSKLPGLLRAGKTQNSKLKTLFLTGEYPPMQGGIADHTAILAQHLAPLGIESPILINRRWQKTNLQSPISQSLEVHSTIPNWGWRCWPAITKFLAMHQPDILHIQYQAAAFDLGGWVNWLPWYLRRKKRQFSTKVVTTFHDLRVPYIFPKAGPFRWKSMLALARHSDAVICTNREDLNQLSIINYQLPITNYQLPNLVHIPLGSNVEPQPPADFDRKTWRAKYGADDNTLLLAYFGFLNESKGGEELIEATARLRRQGIDARLLLIGGDVGHADPTNAAYAQKVQRLIDRCQLAAMVHRTGYVALPQVSANLLAADAVVMPYRDGVSFRRTTLIAALRHGCPVVSTSPANPAFMPEIRPGENMLLAPAGDAAALAESIIPLANSLELRQKLSQGAKALGNLFEWRNIARQTAALYQTTHRPLQIDTMGKMVYNCGPC
jgi:glycosyltransferase involved in cell wall biosynthesis